jgi:hypothetical protein
MNLELAKKELEKHHNIIGKVIEGKTITNIVIVPTLSNDNDKLYARIYMNLSTDDILSKYNDFKVVVIYDIDKFRISGLLLTDNIDHILEYI